jgi:NADH-quinone oxidoreductase subunit J
MTGVQIMFLLVALFTLGSGFMVVTTRNLVHAALWLVSTLFGVAVTFALLNASFLAVVQVVVYIGAIAILFIFAVMLTRKDMRDQGPQMNSNWWAGALIAVLVFAGLLLLLQGWNGLSKTASDMPAGFDAISALGDALVSPNAYVLPIRSCICPVSGGVGGRGLRRVQSEIGEASWFHFPGISFLPRRFSALVCSVLSRGETRSRSCWASN